MSSIKTMENYLKPDYLPPAPSSSSSQYDASQSPLALLAQTCSSIGKDSPLPISNTKSSSTKRTLSTQIHSTKKSSMSSKSNSRCRSPSLIDANVYSNPLYDPRNSLSSLYFRSSLAYLSSQQQQQQQQQQQHSCIIPGCLQCETVRQVFSNSLNHPILLCHSPLNEFIEHRLSKTNRFHPYLKPSRMIVNPDDQLPFFYPHLSLSSMTETRRHTNNHPKQQ